MHRPGGYLVGHGPEGVVDERDTFTCGHCNRVVVCGHKDRAADVGGFCKLCTKLVCGPCVDDGRCTPLEARLQAMEQSQDARRSYGIG